MTARNREYFGDPANWTLGMPRLWVLVDWTRDGEPKRSRCPVDPEWLRELGFDPATPDGLRGYLAALITAGGHDDCAVLSAVADENQDPSP